MVKTISYQEKAEKMEQWIPQILEEIKRDIKREHLRKVPVFAQKFFSGRNIASITTEEIIDVYTPLLKRGEPQLFDQICYFWQVKHPEIYPFFQAKLRVLSEDVSTITEIDDAFAEKLVQEALKEFGEVNTYLFALFYEVAFSDAIYDKMFQEAKRATDLANSKQNQEEEERNLELLKAQNERLLMRLRDKYEKKLSALEDKYHTDVAVLRKEVASLKASLAVK